jgi:hypothetical protein
VPLEEHPLQRLGARNAESTAIVVVFQDLRIGGRPANASALMSNQAQTAGETEYDRRDKNPQ